MVFLDWGISLRMQSRVPEAVDLFAPTLEAACARIAAVQASDYARSRNAVEGAVSYLSPYITHGFVALPEVLTAVAARHRVKVQDKFVYELGWREYFRHVWHHLGTDILDSLHDGLLRAAQSDWNLAQFDLSLSSGARRGQRGALDVDELVGPRRGLPRVVVEPPVICAPNAVWK